MDPASGPSPAAPPALRERGSGRGRLAAVVLTGGTGSRLGGADKAGVVVGAATLLEHALAATAAAAETVVVGEPVPTSRPVVFAREDPPGGGPAAGLLAGLDRLPPGADLVCVLAVDMPLVRAGTVARLVAAAEADPSADGATLVDPRGVRQPLAAVYRPAALARARPADRAAEVGLPVRRLVAGLALVGVPARGGEAHDVDTWQDLRDLRRRDPR